MKIENLASKRQWEHNLIMALEISTCSFNKKITWATIKKSLKYGLSQTALCNYHYYKINCAGCVVSKKTKLPECQGTPYIVFLEYINKFTTEYAKRDEIKELICLIKKVKLFLEEIYE